MPAQNAQETRATASTSWQPLTLAEHVAPGTGKHAPEILRDANGTAWCRGWLQTITEVPETHKVFTFTGQYAPIESIVVRLIENSNEAKTYWVEITGTEARANVAIPGGFEGCLQPLFHWRVE